MKLEFGIAKTNEDLRKIFSLKYKVFHDELHAVSYNADKLCGDKWNDYAINTYLKFSGELVAVGRIIYYSKQLEFRISSSLDLSKFFSDNRGVVEISGLAVSEKYRHLRFGNLIHYLRIKIAIALDLRNIIATASEKNSVFLEQMGFEVLADKFQYQNSNVVRNYKLLSLDLTSDKTQKNIEVYFQNQLGDLFSLATDMITGETSCLAALKMIIVGQRSFPIAE